MLSRRTLLKLAAQALALVGCKPLLALAPPATAPIRRRYRMRMLLTDRVAYDDIYPAGTSQTQAHRNFQDALEAAGFRRDMTIDTEYQPDTDSILLSQSWLASDAEMARMGYEPEDPRGYLITMDGEPMAREQPVDLHRFVILCKRCKTVAVAVLVESPPSEDDDRLSVGLIAVCEQCKALSSSVLHLTVPAQAQKD